MCHYHYFLPWVGKDYEKSMFGKRVLAVGESFYCKERCTDCGVSQHPQCARAVNNRVGYYLDGRDRIIEYERWMNTYLKFERSLVGHETDSQESHSIWDNFAFYNYLQKAMGDSRIAGTTEQYKSSEEAFSVAMNQLQPDLTIVWGCRLWKKLSFVQTSSINQMYKVDDYIVKNINYNLSNGKLTNIMCVNHPSSGYDWIFWNKVIKLFL